MTTAKRQRKRASNQLWPASLLILVGLLCFAACEQEAAEPVGPISGRSFNEDKVVLIETAEAASKPAPTPAEVLDKPKAADATATVPLAHEAVTAQEPDAEPGAPPLLSFAVLASYTFEVHWGKTKEQLPKQIPDRVLEWNGKRVRTAGFMIPLTFTKDQQVKTFYLIRDTGNCCFNGKPALNNMIIVTVAPGVKCQYIAYAPLEVRGVIDIGENVQFNRVVSVYRMTAEKIRYVD